MTEEFKPDAERPTFSAPDLTEQQPSVESATDQRDWELERVTENLQAAKEKLAGLQAKPAEEQSPSTIEFWENRVSLEEKTLEVIRSRQT